MLYREFRPFDRVCAGRLVWRWGVYAMAMTWAWNGLTAVGFPAPAVWAVAGLAGVLLLPATWEG